jgi:heptosyltransferase III
MIDLSYKTVIISRTDSIGDVCLTLPLCTYLKQQFEGIRIVFLGNTYTAPVISCCDAIDLLISWKELSEKPKKEQVDKLKSLNAFAIIHVFPRKEIAKLAKKARIPHRIGTSHRFFHQFTCNHRISFTRKNAEEHESQLNFHLLKPFGIKNLPSFTDLKNLTTLTPKVALPNWLNDTFKENTKTVILHPKSQGSAVEWGVDNFIELGNQLIKRGFTVIYTGTEQEGKSFRNELPQHEKCVDTTGKLTLDELIALISQTSFLIAASTGPLHIAGLLNRNAIGLFAPRRPIHPGRWMPLGNNSTILVNDENCSICTQGNECSCIRKISVERVEKCIDDLFDETQLH